jgi:hypothetical protein
VTTPLVDPCGCGHEAAAPEQDRRNLPGLSRLFYRVGTYASITRAMQDALAGYPALRALTTRDHNDPAIALLDAFAVMGDVLTFYQERIANEGFLRTATQRRSILELARAIGYELKPGVAAGTYLTFTMDESKGAPPRVTIAAGSRVQSVPGQDEKPQMFETTETIEARVQWNALKAKSTEMIVPASGATQVYFEGTETRLEAGDVLIFVGKLRRQDPSSEQWDLRRIRSVETDIGKKHTLVQLQEPMNFRMDENAEPEVYALRQRAALFGHNAPNWRAMPRNVKNAYVGLPEGDTSSTLPNEWPHFTIAGVSDLASGTADDSGLVGEYYNGLEFLDHAMTRIDAGVDFAWGSSSPDPRVRPDNFSVRWRGWIRAATTGTYSFQTRSDDGVRLWVNNVQVINKWIDQSPTDWEGSIHLTAGHRYPLLLEYYEKGGNSTIKLSWRPPNTANYVVIPATSLSYAPEIHLDGLHPKVTPQSWVALATPQYTELYRVESAAEDARANFTLSGKSTRLNLSGENLFEKFDSTLRETTVLVQSERLTVAERPLATPVSGTSLTLASRVEGLTQGRPVEISGKLVSDGSERREIAIIGSIEQAGTTLRFAGLAYSYRPDSVTVNANVARATHGEAKFEVLGNGDATRPFQRFVLKQRPVTYISAATARGAESTLEVRVNDVRWHEVDTLHERSADERVFVTRRSDEGAVTVVFGDGVSGARPASGNDNVTAQYRVGIGLAGLVKAGQLSLLMTRPLGVREVRNTLDATGAADPENRDDARANAPLTVLTLDRVVSLQDYEDYARAFAGIGKARATWLWDGEKRFVHVSVAGAAGADVPANSTLYQDLVKSLDAAREPTRRVSVQSYMRLPFYISAAVAVDPDYVKDKVHAAVKAALSGAFSFARRSFGAPVSKAEVLAVVQRVAGIIAADLNTLDTQQPGTLHPVLFAPGAAWKGQGNPPTTAASLLLLADGGVALTDMAP